MKAGRNYALTDELIKNAYMDIIKNENRMPTQEEVAKKCNITRKTVNEHLNKIELRELVKPFKIFGNHVLIGLRDKAMAGDTQAAKLFFMLIYDWSEKQQVEHKGEVKTVIEVRYDKGIKERN